MIRKPNSTISKGLLDCFKKTLTLNYEAQNQGKILCNYYRMGGKEKG